MASGNIQQVIVPKHVITHLEESFSGRIGPHSVSQVLHAHNERDMLDMMEITFKFLEYYCRPLYDASMYEKHACMLSQPTQFILLLFQSSNST